MKKLLLSLLLAAAAAQAGVFATSKNTAGGMMVLLDEKCNDRAGYIAYTQASGAATIFGCWLFDGKMIHIRWSDGDVRSYPAENWTVEGRGV